MVAAKTLDNIRRGSFMTKLRAGGRYTDVRIEVRNNRLEFNFGYFPPLQEEIKARFSDRRYHGYIEGDGRKIWSAPINYRNLFQLEAIECKHCNGKKHSFGSKLTN